MAKAKNSFEVMARKASARIDEARAAGAQLTFLPDEVGGAVEPVEDRAPGRPKGAKGKVNNQMRDWLASKGYRMPEDVLAQMAGLASSDDAVLIAMQQAELVLAWAYDGQKDSDGNAVMPSGPQRMNAFTQLYTIQLRAADALLPYGAPKATPDVQVNQQTNIIVPAAPATPRDVTPQGPVISGRMVPADVAHEMQQKQEVSNSATDRPNGENSDGEPK